MTIQARRKIFWIVLVLCSSILVVGASYFVISFNTPDLSAPTVPPTQTQPQTTPTSKKDATSEDTAVALTNTQELAGYLNAYGRNNASYPADTRPINFTPETLGFPARASDSVIAAPDGFTITYTPLPDGCTTAARTCRSYSLQLKNVSTDTIIFTGTSPSGAVNQ